MPNVFHGTDEAWARPRAPLLRQDHTLEISTLETMHENHATIARRSIRTVLAGGVLAFAGCTTAPDAGPPVLGWSECQPEQVEVLILGTFHFDQQEAVDILAADRQAELAQLLAWLAEFAPDKVAVEHPYARNEPLNELFEQYLQAPEGSIGSSNETYQIGFRLARRLGHDQVLAVDVPMNLWHDSIQVFDEQYPGARQRLRRRWNVQYPPSPKPTAGAPLADLIRAWNTEPLPAMPEFGRFMPLVEGDLYAGALKLRPWYDRNLRIVQNLFRVLEEGDDRIFLVIGGSHVPVLRQIIDLTPQLCAVDALPYIPDTSKT